MGAKALEWAELGYRVPMTMLAMSRTWKGLGESDTRIRKEENMMLNG